MNCTNWASTLEKGLWSSLHRYLLYLTRLLGNSNEITHEKVLWQWQSITQPYRTLTQKIFIHIRDLRLLSPWLLKVGLCTEINSCLFKCHLLKLSLSPGPGSLESLVFVYYLVLSALSFFKGKTKVRWPWHKTFTSQYGEEKSKTLIKRFQNGNWAFSCSKYQLIVPAIYYSISYMVSWCNLHCWLGGQFQE